MDKVKMLIRHRKIGDIEDSVDLELDLLYLGGS